MAKNNSWNKYDELIQKSLKADMNSIPEKITDEEMAEMGYAPVPEGAYDRIIKRCEEAEKPFLRNPRKIIKAVLIAAILASVVVMSIYGVRVYVFNIKSQVTENSIQFQGVNENAYTYDASESQAYADAEKQLGATILKPTNLPDGYVFDNIKIYSNQIVILIYRSESKSIRITQTLLNDQTHTGDMIDTKNGSTYKLTAHGKEIDIAEHNQLETKTKWLSAVWNDEILEYKVEGNCTKDEFVEFIQNLK